tara:strand:+ start:156 stop:1025 length:870 start_codon:yes stop_codon:yes gene_type:complete
MNMPSAAVVFVSDDGQVGLGLRSNSVHHPYTWAAIGGFRELGETGYQTVFREVWEELGINMPNRIEYLGSTGPHELYLCRVRNSFQPRRLNWENLDFQWRTLLEWNGYNLHPELRKVLRGRRYLAEEDYESTRKWIEKNYGQKWPSSTRQSIVGSGNIQAGGNIYTQPGHYYGWSNKPDAQPNLVKEMLKKRQKLGGIPMNWLNLFGPTKQGMMNLMDALGLDSSIITKLERKKYWKKKPEDYPHPYDPKPREYPPWSDPRTTAHINPMKWWSQKKNPYDYCDRCEDEE